MGIASDLRQSVLQAAVQGKLTTQKAEDGDARELLRAIREEKEKLVKEKKIKKEKPLAPITDEEIPFDIPENWVWCRLGEVGIFVRGNGIKRNEIVESSDYPCIRYGELYTTYHLKTNKVHSRTSKDVFEKAQKAHYGDILMALTGENNKDIALAVAYLGTNEVAYGGDMTVFHHHMEPMYLSYVINSFYFIKIKSNLAKGNIIVHISNDKLSTIPIPLPPLPEQQRIVSRIDALMKGIDELEQTEKELEAIKAAFPGDMKASLLQAAMEGKLTEQKAEDGDARGLVLAIREEKEKLVKEKKGKREKPLAPIAEDEIPFDIPDNWVWCRLGDVFNINTGLSFSKGDKCIASAEGETIRVLRGGNILDNYLYKIDSSDIFVPRSKYAAKCISLNTGDFITPAVTSMEKMCKVAFIDKDLEDITAGGFVYIIKGINKQKLLPKYALYFWSSEVHKNLCKPSIHKSGQAFYNLKKSNLLNQVFPLPPLPEQQRIVEKLDQLLPLCDSLSEH